MPETRRGRPPSTSARELELIALRLFAEQGFDETTVDQIATGAGVSRRTFFRYFDAKSSVLWAAFDDEVANLRAVLAELPPELPVLAAVRRAVLAVNHYSAADVPELRARMNLISSSPNSRRAPRRTTTRGSARSASSSRTEPGSRSTPSIRSRWAG